MKSKVGFCCLYATFMISPLSMAEIPEPSNLIYGKINIDDVPASADDLGLLVSARLGSSVIASYQFGSKAELEDNYLLSIPLDSEGDRAPGSARVGDQLALYVANIFSANVTVGQRGSLLPTDLSISLQDYQTLDGDGDGIPDYIESQFSYLDENTADDALMDEDGDGYTNLEEFLANTDPSDANIYPFLTDYTFTLNFESASNTAESEGELGVMVRYQGPDNYYRFSWNNRTNTQRLVKNLDGVFSLLVETNQVMEASQVYTLTVVLEGHNISVSLDGSEIFNVQDSSISKGPMAFYAYGDNKAVFDNLVVIDNQINRQVQQQFNDNTALDTLSIIDRNSETAPSSWKIENQSLVQDAILTDSTAGAEIIGKLGSYAVFQLNDKDLDGIPDESDDFPNDNNAFADKDQDGLPDSWELEHGLDPTMAEDAYADSDQDGFSNIDEYKNQTDPRAFDVNRSKPAQQALGTVIEDQISSLTQIDTSTFATTSAMGSKIEIWDIGGDLATPIASLDTQANNGLHSSASYDGEVIVGTGDASIQVWDVANKELRFEFSSLHGSVLAVDVNDAYYLAATTEGVVIILDKEGKLLTQWNTASLFISDIKISNGLIYITASKPGETTVWDLTGALQYRITGGDSVTLPNLAVTQNGTLLMAGVESRKEISQLKSAPATVGGEVDSEILTSNDHALTSLYIHANSQRAISGDEKGNLYITQLPSGQLLRTFNAHDRAIADVILTDSQVISAAINGEIRVWNLE